MDGAHAIRQLEGEQVSTCLGNNFKGAEVFLREFLGWSSGSDVVGLDEHLITDGEGWSWSLVLVSRGGVMCLCG